VKAALRIFHAAVFLACMASGVLAAETIRLPRGIASLHLGDRLETVRKIYVSSQTWPSQVELKQGVNRIRIERSYLKTPDPEVDVFWLGMRRNKLVSVQLVYGKEYSQKKSVEALAAELSLLYGEPRTGHGQYWWEDGKSVLRVSLAELPVPGEGGDSSVELRTAIELAEAKSFP
jgi:hypothetical protein